MEKRAREIFRDALALHYIDGICAAGEEVELWLKTHGGWLPDPQEVYGDGTPLTQPEDEGWDVMSKEPKGHERGQGCHEPPSRVSARRHRRGDGPM